MKETKKINIGNSREKLEAVEKKIKSQASTIIQLQGANIRIETQYTTNKNEHAELSRRVNGDEATNKAVEKITEEIKKDVDDINMNFPG